MSCLADWKPINVAQKHVNELWNPITSKENSSHVYKCLKIEGAQQKMVIF